MWICSFKDSSLPFVFCQESLCPSVNVYSNLPPLSHCSNCRLVHVHFVIGTPSALSMRHWLTVAGNHEWFFFWSSLFVFLAKKLLHKVCLKTNTVLCGKRREEHCYYTINCRFGGTKGLFIQRWDSIISIRTLRFMFKMNSIFDCKWPHACRFTLYKKQQNHI